MKHWSSNFFIFYVLQARNEKNIVRQIWRVKSSDWSVKCLEILAIERTNFKVTNMDENAKDSKGISPSSKSRHSDDSGPGEKWGLFNLAKKIMYVCTNQRGNEFYVVTANAQKWMEHKFRDPVLTWPISGMSNWANGEIISTSAPASSQVSLIAPSTVDSPISR